MKNLNINELAKKLNLSAETLRKWEARYNLIIPRNQKNSRYYSTELVELITKINELKNQDFLDNDIITQLQLNSNEIKLNEVQQTSKELQGTFISEIKETFNQSIKDNNELAFNLAKVSNELGFFKGQNEYIKNENEHLKIELNNKQIELKNSLELNNILNQKEKHILELEFKLKNNSIELQNLHDSLIEVKKEKVELQNKLNEAQQMLDKINKMSFLEKLRFRL
jgi:DNA-binding transcriptional MerR regulator